MIGPPELSRERGPPAQMRQAVDIWSLGCVLSEAATWVVLGQKGIKIFEKVRSESRERAISEQLPSSLQSFKRGDFFHDGEGLLKEVLEWHKYLRRPADEVTTSIIDLLDHQVLGDPTQRITIKDLCKQLDDIVKEQKSTPRRAILPGPSSKTTNGTSPKRNHNDTSLTQEDVGKKKDESEHCCWRIVERYSVCRCIYYQHAIDMCPRYGQYGHNVEEKTVLVGYACSAHSS